MSFCEPRHHAFSMVEVTLALGVVAISMLAILGLLAAGSQVNRTATDQTASSDILSAVANDLRATPGPTATSLGYGITIPSNPVASETRTTLYFNSAGEASTSQVSGSRYRLVLTFLPTGAGRFATRVSLRMTWPAAADPTNANTQSAEMFLALDRN